MYGKRKAVSRNIECNRRWKVCAALRKPNVIRGNSNSPNGVQIAVFSISVSSIGTWWYARTKSIFEKNLQPFSWCVKSVTKGIG